MSESHSRWPLQLQAQTWRGLMGIGMHLHRLPFGPDSYSYSFTHTILSTISKSKGSIDLLFYTPKGYKKPCKRKQGEESSRYPVLVNFHGGGFTIGTAHDDSRWCDAVANQVEAVVVSVEYRLAPEYPFPTAVEDGADAILYLIENADELGIDPSRIAISGFSAGANMAFTVPLMLQREFKKREGAYKEGMIVDQQDKPKAQAAVGRIQAIMAWYPPTDYATHTRKERRETNVRPDKSLPEFFTDLFDASYLYHPTEAIELDSPYLSPGLAPDHMLQSLPDDIVIYICEWDELRAEAEKFRDRLQSLPGKRVTSRIIEGVVHGFDKSPNPLWVDHKTQALYREACAELKNALTGDRLTEIQVDLTDTK